MTIMIRPDANSGRTRFISKTYTLEWILLFRYTGPWNQKAAEMVLFRRLHLYSRFSTNKKLLLGRPSNYQSFLRASSKPIAVTFLSPNVLRLSALRVFGGHSLLYHLAEDLFDVSAPFEISFPIG